MNREKQSQYNINSAAWRNREPGISAFVRLANEEEWIGPAIESILPWVDEVVCTLQCSTDYTEQVLREFDDSKIRIYQYPFESWPNGPGHSKQPGDSLHNNAYFYNWSLSLTRYQWALKWDGDMVAFDWLGERVREIIEAPPAAVRMNGINLVGDCACVSKEQPVIRESQPRLFQVRPGVYYLTGALTQTLTYPAGTRRVEIDGTAYLHFKWAKKSCYQGWPDNWQNIPHFTRIAKRQEPGEQYAGGFPSVIQGSI